MKKSLFTLIVVMSTALSACTSPSSGPYSRSGVQVYGTIDAGVGHTRQTIKSGDGSKTTRTRSGVRSY